ncbi:MAG: DoxX family protein [Patescibacteria group bacterium]
MKKIVNTTSRFFYNPNFGLLLIRVAAGLIFLTHGWMKIQNMEQTVMFLGQLGIIAPLVYFISWLEVIGGLALILGIATRLFGFLFGVEMLVATVMVGLGRGINIEIVLSLISFAIALTGSGKYSVYKMECDHCSGLLCNGAAGTCTVLPK